MLWSVRCAVPFSSLGIGDGHVLHPPADNLLASAAQAFLMIRRCLKSYRSDPIFLEQSAGYSYAPDSDGRLGHLPDLSFRQADRSVMTSVGSNSDLD
jgi:hypothetical protein